MSVKRAVTVCSLDVALDILKGPLPPDDTVGTRTYLKQCHKLFQIFNNNTEVDPESYKQLISIMMWFDTWYKEVKQIVRSLSAKYRPDRYRRDKSVKFGTELP